MKKTKRQVIPARSSTHLRSWTVVIPGKERGQLPFVLAVLNGKHMEKVRQFLMWHLEFDFTQFRTPETDRDWEALTSIEMLDYAVTAMVETMRQVADMWIDSGKSGTEYDSPKDRKVDVILPGKDYSLYRRMHARLFLSLPQYVDMLSDGTRRVRGTVPHFDRTRPKTELKAALEDFGERFALHEFAVLLNSKDSRRIARCDNCKVYFAYKRARLRQSKRGVYCPRCKTKGGTRRKQESRKARFKYAAKMWLEWGEKRRRPGQAEWVLAQVNRKFKPKPGKRPPGKRWVTQNIETILKYVEEQGRK